MNPDQGEESLTASAVEGSVVVPQRDLVQVPSEERLQLLRQGARESGTTHKLHQMVSAMEAAAQKCDLAFEELLRLAVFRLQVERDLGVYLSQTVVPGRPRKRSPGGTDSETVLPKWINKKRSSAYQQLAAVADELFQQYIEASRKWRRVPTSKGARLFAVPRVAPSGGRRKRTGGVGRSGVPALTPQLLDICERCLGTVDVLIGQAKVEAGIVLDSAADLGKRVKGTVLVAEHRDPARSLEAIAGLVRRGVVSQAVVALPRDIDAGWLASLGRGAWSCCVPHGQGPILAHIGIHARAFTLLGAEVGVVLLVQSDGAEVAP